MSAPRIRALSALAVAILAALVATSAPASAQGRTVLKVAYKASGSTLIKSTNSTVALPATTLTTALDNKGNFTGTLPLKPTTSSFKALGLLPVTATVTFVPSGKVTGKLVANPKTKVTATSKYTIKLSNVTVAGLPALVGDSCATTTPASITVSTPKGRVFDITKGGIVSGTYTIGKFANCGLTTGLVNLLIPGPGNTVRFTLSSGKTLK